MPLDARAERIAEAFQTPPTRRAPPQQALMPAEPTRFPARQPGDMSAAELFSQLFPDGVQITGELFADLEQWIRFTGMLAAGGNGTTP